MVKFVSQDQIRGSSAARIVVRTSGDDEKNRLKQLGTESGLKIKEIRSTTAKKPVLKNN